MFGLARVELTWKNNYFTIFTHVAMKEREIFKGIDARIY